MTGILSGLIAFATMVKCGPTEKDLNNPTYIKPPAIQRELEYLGKKSDEKIDGNGRQQLDTVFNKRYYGVYMKNKKLDQNALLTYDLKSKQFARIWDYSLSCNNNK